MPDLFLLVWKGAVRIGENSPDYETFHTLVLSHEDGETGVKLTAGKDDTQFVLVCTLCFHRELFLNDFSGKRSLGSLSTRLYSNTVPSS